MVRQPQHRVSQGRAGAVVDVLEGARGALHETREDGADMCTRQHHPRHAQTARLHPQRRPQRGAMDGRYIAWFGVLFGAVLVRSYFSVEAFRKGV